MSGILERLPEVLALGVQEDSSIDLADLTGALDAAIADRRVPLRIIAKLYALACAHAPTRAGLDWARVNNAIHHRFPLRLDPVARVKRLAWTEIRAARRAPAAA